MVWAYFLSHHEDRRMQLGYELVRRRLRRGGLRWEGLEGDTIGVLAGRREFPMQM
jgi:hypothetical protein